ncbi:unnamed protein product [Darwinula stevensoni]|uniref:Uncharacterized protein n=1 Tax=Darwinula stevensoni TaxID=69355 RepID=A0A7R8XC87_9CRUS|nr:unnamed protein product [Darwinula stevensoni]CAG0887254.1 unnamed protein product [Darwinula stevensoni]
MNREKLNMNLIYCGSPAAVLFRIGAASCCGGTYESVNRQLYHSLRSFQTSARRKVISVYRNLDQATSSEEDPLGAEDNGSHAHRMALQQRSQQVSSMEESLKSPWVQRLFNGMLNQNRGMLAQAITLAESTHPRNKVESQALLSMVLAHAKDEYEKAGASALSFRIGLSGPPGAGKSTFIESFGKQLTALGHKVAVLAVDPSSSKTGGWFI